MTVTEVRAGRNFIRVGDLIKVLPRPGRRDGFEARVSAIVTDDESGAVRWFEVHGGRKGQYQFHAVRPDRVTRLAQTRQGERRERRR